jgi:hypothetical protein
MSIPTKRIERRIADVAPAALASASSQLVEKPD